MSVTCFIRKAAERGSDVMREGGYPPLPLLIVQRTAPVLGHNHVLNQDLGTGFQCANEASKDTRGVFIGPIVEDAAKEVDLCPLDRLLGEEVVSHEFQSTFKLRRNRAAGYSAWKVLDDAFQIGKVLD